MKFTAVLFFYKNFRDFFGSLLFSAPAWDFVLCRQQTDSTNSNVAPKKSPLSDDKGDEEVDRFYFLGNSMNCVGVIIGIAGGQSVRFYCIDEPEVIH